MNFADKHSRHDKELLRLDRELDRLRLAQWHAPIVPLEHPYQRGWVKTLVLREDAAHHPDAKVFRAVLAAVNQRVFWPRRDFLRRDGSVVGVRPKLIRLHEWRSLAWSPAHQRLFAWGSWSTEDSHSCGLRRGVPGFRLMRPWFLEEAIFPHMITHQRVDLPEVRSRIAEIENRFARCLGRERLLWLRGRRVRWHPSRAGSIAARRAADAALASV
ncbi:MAG TPA: hypothetical protein VEB66_07095 [Opitutaceae bacterium]|nr:hypothetical protein [Opitutaceae bacterium]